MFEAVRNNKRIVQVILGLITLSFAFFGIESYLSNTSKDSDVAEVGGTTIARAELDRALRDQQERIRSAREGKVDEATFRSAEFRQAVLNNLINQRVLALHAGKNRLAVGDRQIQETIAGIPAFQSDGRFDPARYDAVLRAQGMNQPIFESRLRQDLAIQQLVNPVGEGALVSQQAAIRLLQTQLEQREIRVQEIRPAAFLAKVIIAESAIKQFYDSNVGLFERPARVRAEYVALDSAAAEKEIQVPDEDVRKWYSTHQEKYVTTEERRASHILIQVPPGAPEAEVAKARATIDRLLTKLREDPSSFGRLAKEASQDPGSAGNEGDLGYFGRGVMVKAFEDAAFGLQKPGDLAGPIRSDFGFHIIKLTEVKAARARPFEDVASEIRNELKKQGVSKRFAEMAEAFSNMVYEQADSLAPVVERFKLKPEQTDWISKGSEALGNYKNNRLVDALFAEDAIAKHRNTEAIDVGGGTLIAARVLAHEPAHRLSLDEARPQIESQLRAREASKLAIAEGQTRLEGLKKRENVSGDWSAPRVVQRGPGLPRDLARAVFEQSADKLPGYAGVGTQDGGFAIIKLEKVTKATVKSDDPRLQAVRGQYEQLLGRLELNGYLAQLRSRYGVEISPAAARDATE
jgi:peptidyl-prolyl cis-trans isomerase D